MARGSSPGLESTTPEASDQMLFRGISVAFFDLDDTLYPNSSDIQKFVGIRIHKYLQTIGIPEHQCQSTISKYTEAYGVVIRGLLEHHPGVCPHEYNAFVDGSIALEEMIRPDPQLRVLFQSLPSTMRRWIFTNAGITHTKRTLHCLGIEDLVDGITFCEYSDPSFTCKPQPSSFLKAMKEAQVSDPGCCLFVDDRIGNLRAAKLIGWRTVLVAENGVDQVPEFVDCCVKRVTDLSEYIEIY